MSYFSYRLEYGFVPFSLDKSDFAATPGDLSQVDVVDEVNRLLPEIYRNDVHNVDPIPNKNLRGVTQASETFPDYSLIRVGDWYYPTGARRWSLFRGLATTTQVQRMMSSTRTYYDISQSGFVSGGFSGGLNSSGEGVFYSGSVPYSGAMNYGPVVPTPATGGSHTGMAPRPFTIHALPFGARQQNNNYLITTNLYMLPPRPLGEVIGSRFDGLYLVTLVDDRFYSQNSPVLMQVKAGMSWGYLFDQLAVALGITLNSHSPIESVYGSPEPDSALWSNWESAATLLDACAENVGRTVVRQYDGSYTLYTPAESQSVWRRNRHGVTPAGGYVRVAGGEIFHSGVETSRYNLRDNKSWIIPQNIKVTFPKYIQGNDPVPHFADPRYQSPRRSVYNEDSYGDCYVVNVPVFSGGGNVSGYIGNSDAYLHNTAKALLSGEVSISSGEPLNLSGLRALSVQLAQNYYNYLTLSSLDEVYPGILNWEPEGLHDLIFTYSARSQGAFTRAIRSSWTNTVTEFCHTTPPASGGTSTPPGVAGKSVAQSIRDSYGSGAVLMGLSGRVIPSLNDPTKTTTFQSGGIWTLLADTMLSGAMSGLFFRVDYLPTQNRWWGKISPITNSMGELLTSGKSSEIILFEGTSGGIANPLFPNTRLVGIANRGCLGTVQQEHASGSLIQQVLPDTGYGINLTTYEKMQFVYPSEWTSGGIQGANIVPQIQDASFTVVSEGASGLLGQVFNGIRHWSGRINTYDPTGNPAVGSGQRNWRGADLVWMRDRNAAAIYPSGVQRTGIYSGGIPSGVDPNTTWLSGDWVKDSDARYLLGGMPKRDDRGYEGQFVGYSPSTSGASVAPIYAIDTATDNLIVKLTTKDINSTPIKYGWIAAGEGAGGAEGQLSYDPFNISGGNGGWPLLHEDNYDIPVPSVVRAHRGQGRNFWFGDEPRWEFVRRLSDTREVVLQSGSFYVSSGTYNSGMIGPGGPVVSGGPYTSGQIGGQGGFYYLGQLLRYNQVSRTFQNVQLVLLVDATVNL